MKIGKTLHTQLGINCTFFAQPPAGAAKQGDFQEKISGIGNACMAFMNRGGGARVVNGSAGGARATARTE
jgi:hypothetical protein